MNVVERYKSAREIYKKVGVDTDLAIRKLLNFPISMHCWQGDDVVRFDGGGRCREAFKQPVIIQERLERPKN